MIQWKCISCGATIKGPDHLEGKEVKCPKCKERIRLKADGETEKSAAKDEKKPDKATETKKPDTEAEPEKGEPEEKAEPEEEEEKEDEGEKDKPEKEEEPAEEEKELGPMPGPAPVEEKADEDLPSAKDLLSEVKGEPGPGPAPAPAEPEKEKPAAEEKKRPAPPPPMPGERGLPINLIVGLIGIIAIAVTAYVIYQKSQVTKEQDRTRRVVKDLRDKLDKIRDTVKKGEGLVETAEYDKAEEEVKDIDSAIKRLISDVELELGAAVTDFTKEQRSRLIEDAEAAREKVDGLLSRIEDSRAETKKMAAFVAEREKEMAEVETALEKAKKQMADADYVSAQRTLRRAKSDAEDVVEEIEFEEDDITRPELKKKLADCKTKAEANQKAIETLLKSGDIINGSRGLVKHEGKWMTPEQKAEAMQPKAKPAAGAAAATAAAAAKTPTAFKPDDMEWTIDDFSGPVRWSRQTWGDPGELEVVEINADKMLLVRYQRGGEGKVAIARGMKLDISSRGMLVVDMENRTNQPVQICLAIVTDQFYESQGQNIRPGMNKGISFSLTDASYKCAKDGWLNYNHQIGSLNSLGQMLFMIYPPGTVKEGAMMFDNIRMVAK